LVKDVESGELTGTEEWRSWYAPGGERADIDTDQHANQRGTHVPPIVEARGLTKRFKATQALAALDLTAERGQVTAVLGPNGAGKTTFIRMVATLLQPDAGSLTVAGMDAFREPAKVRQAIGLAGQSAAVEKAMTGRENLERAWVRLPGWLKISQKACSTASGPCPCPGWRWSPVGWWPTPAWPRSVWS